MRMMSWLGIIFLLLAGFSLWIFLGNKKTGLKPATAAVLDGYMTNAHYTQYDNQGQVHINIRTPKMTHYAQDSTAHFEKPSVLAFSQTRIPWTIDAEKGVSIHDSEQVDLSGNVVIHQAPLEGHPETTIYTTKMTLYPHRSFSKTDQPITIVRPDSRIEAVGMEADFKTGIFTLLSAVRGSYVPHSN